MDTFEVIIVGGRPAGSTLAARLGKQGVRTLLLERAEFPTLPAVSSPIVFAPTLEMLDEIGADEAAYAHNTPKIKRMMQWLSPETAFTIPLPDSNGRDYAYAVDRARFDATLWDTALRYPCVTGIQSFNVTDLLWEGDQVVGVVGSGADKVQREFRAPLVVGADGRFSAVARKVNATSSEEHVDYPTSIYYAYWKHVRPYDEGSATGVSYAGVEPGYGTLIMDSADNTAAVTMEGRSDVLDDHNGRAEAFYLDMLERSPAVWSRLEGAEMVTTVRGMKRIGNLYRQAGGKGWVLVGDAYHQKDPLDGQGIYNAVFSAKALALAIKKWRSGEMEWAAAVEWYDETVRIRTYGMYRSLLARVQATLYAPQPPEWIMNTFVKWTADDRELQELLGKFLTHQMSPDVATLMTPPVMLRALMRGSLRDLGERVKQTLSISGTTK